MDDGEVRFTYIFTHGLHAASEIEAGGTIILVEHENRFELGDRFLQLPGAQNIQCLFEKIAEIDLLVRSFKALRDNFQNRNRLSLSNEAKRSQWPR